MTDKGKRWKAQAANKKYDKGWDMVFGKNKNDKVMTLAEKLDFMESRLMNTVFDQDVLKLIRITRVAYGVIESDPGEENWDELNDLFESLGGGK